jgi:hypothetical protein
VADEVGELLRGRRRDLGEQLLVGRVLHGEGLLHVRRHLDGGRRGRQGAQVDLQILGHRRRGRVALGAVALQGAGDDAHQRLGDVLGEVGRAGDGRLHDRLDQRQLVLSGEEPAAGQRLPEDHPQRPDVGLGVELLALDLLGRHVQELALDLACGGLAELRLGLGDSEVQHLGRALVRDEDVARADVAVDEVERVALRILEVVGVVQPFARADQHPGDQREPEGILRLPEPAQDVGHVLAGDVLHRDVVDVADLVEVEDLRQVGVVHRRRQARLVEEHRDEIRVVRQRRQDALDDEQLLEAGQPALLGEEDLRHPADGDLAQEQVLAELFERQGSPRAVRMFLQ